MVSIRKIATCMLVGTMAFAGHAANAKAAETPVAGIVLSLSEANINTQDASAQIQSILLSQNKIAEANLAFAKVNSYVNIRSKASENSKVLGKLYKDNSATILGKEGDWYQVKSGSVTGYIKQDYLITGKSAEKFAEKTGDTYATVNTTTLKVRDKASTDASVLTLIPIGEEFKVTKEKKDWVKILIDESTSGYVSKDFVDLKKVYGQAISVEEEKAELAKEAETAVLAATVEKNSSNNSTSSSSTKKQSTVTKNLSIETSNSSGIRDRIVDYALKFEGNPYVWGGTSLTRGADCSGFTQSIFEDFGIYIPRTSREQAASGKRVDLDNLRPGDLIFYRRNGSINHVALYIGNGKVIGAKSSDEGIRITSYNYRTPYKAVSYIN